MTPTAVRNPGEVVETRFGQFTYDEHDVVSMVEPLAGFETCTHYLLLSSPEIAPLVCLQGVDGNRPSFLAVPATVADPTYDCILRPEDRARLGLPGGDDVPPLLWLALVRLSLEAASANLRAPIVLNSAKMVGLQIVPAVSSYSTEHPLPLG